MTSVKEFRIERTPGPDELGRGSFFFTDAYSVFDWGKMPDAIPRKGKSLCTMGAFNFELLETAAIPTHYRGVVEAGEVVPLESVSEPPQEMAIDIAQVPSLGHVDSEYDYTTFHQEAGDNYIVPLEIIFRNQVPVGSSLRRRTAPADHDLQYDEWPSETVDLAEPIIEFSTKYEEADRHLNREEADRIAGKATIDDLETIARDVNKVVTDRAESVGMAHHDGKIECLYFRGDLHVADVVGTFDENRFSFDGQQVSKEVIRQYYAQTHPEWVAAVEAAKTEATRRNVADWRPLCSIRPNRLPAAVISLASDLYASGTNEYVGQKLFAAPPLIDVVGRIRSL